MSSTFSGCSRFSHHSFGFAFSQLVATLRTKETHSARLLHCMELLAGVLHVLSTKDLKAACECILELVEFPNSLVGGFLIASGVILTNQLLCSYFGYQ